MFPFVLLPQLPTPLFPRLKRVHSNRLGFLFNEAICLAHSISFLFFKAFPFAASFPGYSFPQIDGRELMIVSERSIRPPRLVRQPIFPASGGQSFLPARYLRTPKGANVLGEVPFLWYGCGYASAFFPRPHSLPFRDWLFPLSSFT